jgi:hypothetical protein
VDGIGSRSCPFTTFGTCTVEALRPDTCELCEC